MPRGGARQGAGRPRKHPPKQKPKATPAQNDPSLAPVVGPKPPGTRVEPLEYMLTVMSDPDANPELRARMAVAAAPYVHKKMGEGGKKEERDERAKALVSKFTPSTPPPRAVLKATH